MSTFRLHTLGCGSAKPSLRHMPSCSVVNHHETLYMIDCGEGAQLALMKQRLPLPKLRHIFLTHLHGDHVLGLPGLIGTMALQQKGGEVTIHTFADGKRILSEIFNYFCRETPFEIRFNVTGHENAVVFENHALRVRSVALDHRVPAVGYVFEEKPKLRHINGEMAKYHEVPHYRMREIKEGADFVKPDGTVVANEILTTPPSPALSYAHLGDTVFHGKIAEEAGPVTLMFHETTYLESEKALAAPYGHSTARQAGEAARIAGAHTLITGHYSSRYKDFTPFKAEAESVFPRVILNDEGLVTDLTTL